MCPRIKLRSRYKKSLLNLSELLKFADVVNVIDNSSDKAEMLLSLKDNQIKIYKCKSWSEESIKKLIDPE